MQPFGRFCGEGKSPFINIFFSDDLLIKGTASINISLYGCLWFLKKSSLFDISTISRVVNSKYIETHFGIYSLKYFFSEGLENQEGEEVSTRELKKALQECVDVEDKHKPLTDDELVVKMTEKGYKLARRTIAKYRDQLGIPKARLRKEL